MILKIQSWQWKKLLKYAVVFCFFILCLILLSNYHIIRSTKEQIYSDATLIPENDVALLLGASKKSRGGNVNLYFKYRIEAAAELFKNKKIRHIIVSGDNHKKEYDEASDMRDALIEKGVPDSCITLDYAGFRTFDSMIRCLKIFGQKNITVISQKFHNQRAVFIGNNYGMNVVAFNAKDVPNKYSLKTKIREYAAKFKAVLDVYLLDAQPKFLGEEVKINI